MIAHCLALDFESIRSRFEHRLAEWYLAACMFLAGIVALTGPTFDLPPYDVLRLIATQETWGWMMAIVGGLRLAVLAINGAMRRSPRYRAWLSVMSCAIWAVLFAGLMSFDTAVLVAVFLGAAVVAEWINTFRAAQDSHSEGRRDGNPR